MRARSQVILPGLFDLPLAELAAGLIAERLPNLNRVLRYATPRPNRAYSIDAILRNALEFGESPAHAFSSLPLAQAFALPDIHAPERLLLGQAIHLQADLHSAVVVPIQENEENLNDINIIINDLNKLFNVDCNVSVIDNGLLLIDLKSISAPTHYPHLLSVLGKTANPYMEQSRQQLPWYQLLNEIQMFMYQHDVNRQRLERGLLPLNSLWAWGGGALAHELTAPPAWFCDDPTLNRFAESLKLNPLATADLPVASATASKIVVDLSLLEWLKTGLDVDPGQLLLKLDRKLLAPLLAEARSGKSSLLLRAGFDFDFEFNALDRIKFWRRPCDLATWNRPHELS